MFQTHLTESRAEALAELAVVDEDKDGKVGVHHNYSVDGSGVFGVQEFDSLDLVQQIVLVRVHRLQ